MERTTEDIIIEAVTERVDQIIMQSRKAVASGQEERDQILKGLDEEMRHRFETFAGTLITESAEEYQIIYRAAFVDGLRLAHQIFR